jgi:hypothetical protein
MPHRIKIPFKIPWIDIIALIIAIGSFFYTRESVTLMKEQFKENSKSSDSIFHIQLANSKALNDSLIRQVKQLQEITTFQLKTSKESFHSQLIGNKPNFILTELPTWDNGTDEYGAKVINYIKNEGRREADSIVIKIYALFGNAVYKEKYIEPWMKEFSFEKIEPNEIKKIDFYLPIHLYSAEFYYYIKIKYYDNVLRRYFKNFIYLRHGYNKGNQIFYDIVEDEAHYKKELNNRLKIFNMTQFD